MNTQNTTQQNTAPVTQNTVTHNVSSPVRTTFNGARLASPVRTTVGATRLASPVRYGQPQVIRQQAPVVSRIAHQPHFHHRVAHPAPIAHARPVQTFAPHVIRGYPTTQSVRVVRTAPAPVAPQPQYHPVTTTTHQEFTTTDENGQQVTEVRPVTTTEFQPVSGNNNNTTNSVTNSNIAVDHPNVGQTSVSQPIHQTVGEPVNFGNVSQAPVTQAPVHTAPVHAPVHRASTIHHAPVHHAPVQRLNTSFAPVNRSVSYY